MRRSRKRKTRKKKMSRREMEGREGGKKGEEIHCIILLPIKGCYKKTNI